MVIVLKLKIINHDVASKISNGKKKRIEMKVTFKVNSCLDKSRDHQSPEYYYYKAINLQTKGSSHFIK